MKTSVLKLSILPLAIALASCASLAPAHNPLAGTSPQAEQAKHDTKMAALKGCGIGAGAGALLGILHGNLKQGIEYAVGGCAVGGIAGGALELDQARSVAAAANASGATASVSTTQVETKNAAGQATKVDQLDQLKIAFSPYKVQRHYAGVSEVAIKAATMASASTVPVRIEVDGSSAQREWLLAVMTPHLTNPATTITERFATNPGLVLSPVPSVPAQE